MSDLTDAEFSRLSLCDCGHSIGSEHNGLGCYGRISYKPLVKCECGRTDEDQFVMERKRANELLAAHIAAERDALLAKFEALHAPFGIYDECGHEHTDEDVAAGRAHNIPEVGYTCALLYMVCRECCTRDDGYEQWQTEECCDHHEHAADKPRCATDKLIREARA